MKTILTLLCSILLFLNVAGQMLKTIPFRYVHNCNPLIETSAASSHYSYFFIRSPYKDMCNHTTTTEYLTPVGYSNSKEKCSYIIELETTEVQPVMNNDGTVRMSIMLMYYSYNVRVKIYDRDGNVITQRDLTLCDQSNTIFIAQPTEALNVYVGDSFIADAYIHEALPQIYQASLADAKEYIDYSFSGKHDIDTFYIFSAKAPKQRYNYKNLDNASILFKNTMLLHNSSKEEIPQIRTNIQKCINVWETELTKANYKDNGARINTTIAMGLHYNLAMAYFVLGNYELAYDHVHQTYKKEVDKHQQLRPFTDFEQKAIALEKTILLCWDK